MLLPLHLNGLNLDSGTATVALSGTAAGGLTEAQVVAGGYTIVLTLTNDTWVAAGAPFNAERQNIIDGLDSDGAEVNGWNNIVRDSALQVTDVVRTSDTVVTITASAAATYDVAANETITMTVPATALTGASPLVAPQTITVTADVATGTGGGGGGFPGIAGIGLRKQRFSRKRLERQLERIVEQAIEAAEPEKEPEKEASAQDVIGLALKMLADKPRVFKDAAKSEKIDSTAAIRAVETRINELVRQRRRFDDSPVPTISDDEDLIMVIIIAHILWP